MKRPSVSNVEGAVILFAAVGAVAFRWAWRASHRGGFPLFSMQTFEVIEPVLAALGVGLVIIWVIARRAKRNE